MYDQTDSFAYNILDEMNELSHKLIEQFATDSMTLFKAPYDGSPTVLVYLNEDGSIDMEEHVLYIDENTLQASFA